MAVDQLSSLRALAEFRVSEGLSPPAKAWPDGVDLAAMAVFVALAFGVPLFGHFLMAVDIRRYLRSLGRALVVLTQATRPTIPCWARRGRPPCLESLGLELPCTEEEVLAAYRRRVKELHPDKGGKMSQFLQLQRHFEQAMHLARTQERTRSSAV